MKYLFRLRLSGPVRKLALSWASSLLVILISVSVAQYIIQTACNNYKHERQTSTMIGMQQGRSLRMAQDAYSLLSTPRVNTTSLQEMISLEPTWEQVQQASYHGDLSLGIALTDLPPPVIVEAYKSNVDYVLLKNAFLDIINKETLDTDSHSPDITGDIAVINAHESKYISHYISIFTSLTNIADANVSNVQQIELEVLYPLTPFILLVEYLIVVRPALQRLQEYRAISQEENSHENSH